MRRASLVQAAASIDPARVQTTVTLSAHDRHRRRIRMVADDGGDFLLDLPNATHLRDGDGLLLDNGGVIVVRAAAEQVIDLHSSTVEQQVRLAWHIGNRHLPVQILPGGSLRLHLDEVLVTMAEGLGARVERLCAPFQPEPGAYDPHGLVGAAEPLIRWAR
ncbi:urease accessory protein UreE [Insolitispirillum peregrinum]|uniref:Urease accessory protein UreE n=1 Tax=Insolitispirillum peregrinum TaxID=80876 RepID=A0A1N7L283_9PROT|nr:urease accessory protein UreE [Insolitispirillum peregrinum]SIS67968.1 urease accessory protein [Insolitispirillum peregrinum]